MARAAWWAGAIIRFVLVPMLGVAALSWWSIGDRSTGGTDSIARIPLLQDHSRRVGAIGVALMIIAAIDLLRSRPIPPSRYALRVLPPVVLGGAAVGFAGRIITAQVHGANIGGGLAILFGPFFLLGMIAWACAALVTDVRRASTA